MKIVAVCVCGASRWNLHSDGTFECRECGSSVMELVVQKEDQ